MRARRRHRRGGRQRQRVQAEGLIEFMLGDLRKKLEPVGRLEVLETGDPATSLRELRLGARLQTCAIAR